MRFRLRPVLVAAGVGAVVQMGMSILSNVIQWVTGTGLDLSSGLRPGQLLDSGVGLLFCLCLLGIDFAVGVLYAFLHTREAPITPGEGVMGGGLAGAVEGLITGVFGAILAAVVMPAVLGQLRSGAPSGLEGLVVGAGLFGGALGIVLGLCLALFRGAILAGAGGAIGAAVFKSRPANV